MTLGAQLVGKLSWRLGTHGFGGPELCVFGKHDADPEKFISLSSSAVLTCLVHAAFATRSSAKLILVRSIYCIGSNMPSIAVEF